MRHAFRIRLRCGSSSLRLPNVIPTPLARDTSKLLNSRGPQYIQNKRDLMVIVPPREDGSPAREDLGEDASDRPDVDGFRVLSEGEHYFGGSVRAGE